MTDKSARKSGISPQPKRVAKSQNGSAQTSGSLVGASVEEVLAVRFASTSKTTKRQKPVKKTGHLQGDAGVPSGDAVPVISKPQSDGFAAKQMPNNPAWIALLYDLGTMSTMALRTKYAGEANTHRNMLQRVKDLWGSGASRLPELPGLPAIGWAEADIAGDPRPDRQSRSRIRPRQGAMGR